MAGSTPTRDARSSRLGSKPYDRPSSASSSAANTPNKATGGGGLLRSLVGKLYSPFGTKNRESATRNREEDDGKNGHDDEKKQQQRRSKLDEESGGFRDWTSESDNKMEFEEEHRYQPILPIQHAIESLRPITPEQSTRLLAKFMADKQARGQAGQQTPEEQQAISELLRRATEDNGKPSVLGESASDGAGRSLSVSKTGRGLFDSPIREKGFVRSNSYDVLAGSPLRNRSSVRPDQGSLARPWRPLHASTLAHSQSSNTSGSSNQQSQSNSFQPQRSTTQSFSEQQPAPKSSNMPFASRQPSSLSKSTSMFALSAHSSREPPSKAAQSNLNHSSVPDNVKADKATSQNSSPAIKSAAARTLENLLSKAEAQSDKKFNVEPISNPYEGYRFHIGSTAAPLSGSSRQSVASSSSRSRLSLKPRARASLGGSKQAPDTSKMSDLDLITASVQAEQTNKRIRKSSPTTAAKGKSSEHSSDRMQVDENPPVNKASRISAAAPPTPARSSYPILERPHSPVKGKPSYQEAQSTTPKQPPPAKSSAFDIISRTIAASAEPEQKARTHVSFASLPSSEPAKLPESSEIPSSSKHQPTSESPDELVRRLDVSVLPVNTFRSLAGGEDLGKSISALARQQALTTEPEKLPRFTFTFRMSRIPTVTATPANLPTSTGFTGWGSGVTPQAGKSNDMWECSTCLCKSPSTSTKCDVCTEPRPVVKVAAPTTSVGFTGWGSGAAPASSTDQWTCSTCMCKSAISSTKCEVCEAPRPGGLPTVPKVANVGFTGWGAGVPVNSKPASTWTCSTCSLQSKETSSKCEVCGADRS